jgi:hypothetical protein
MSFDVVVYFGEGVPLEEYLRGIAHFRALSTDRVVRATDGTVTAEEELEYGKEVGIEMVARVRLDEVDARDWELQQSEFGVGLALALTCFNGDLFVDDCGGRLVVRRDKGQVTWGEHFLRPRIEAAVRAIEPRPDQAPPPTRIA